MAEIFRSLLDKVSAGFNADDMAGAGLERGKTPPPIMAAEVENAAAGQDGHIPADDRTPTRIEARPRGNCFSRFQKTRKAVAEFLLHCTGYGTVCRRENSKLDRYGRCHLRLKSRNSISCIVGKIRHHGRSEPFLSPRCASRLSCE